MGMNILHTRSDDGSKIRLGRWNEHGSKDILLVHGLAEHLGRYEFVGDFLPNEIGESPWSNCVVMEKVMVVEVMWTCGYDTLKTYKQLWEPSEDQWQL